MEIDINEAINQILTNGDFEGTIVSGFDPKKLVYLDGVYNHNYFDYDGVTLLQECDDDSLECYSVVDSETRKHLRNIGFRQLNFDDSDNEICELYVNW